MSDGILTRVARGLSGPATAASDWLYRRLTPDGAIVEVVVEPCADSAATQVWLGRIRRLATDTRVKRVLFWVRAAPGGWAATSDLRTILRELRDAGKTVWAYVKAPGNALIWLASAADRVLMPPTGEVALTGVAIELTFLANGLEQLGLEADVISAGAYKSLGERFTRTHASAENREAMEAIVDGLQDRLVVDLSASRGMPLEEVRAAMREAPLAGEDAAERGLVDVLSYPDEVEGLLKEAFGTGDTIPLSSWASRDALRVWTSHWGRRRRVVVLHLEGPIVMEDDSGRTCIRGRTAVEALDQLREDDKVAGVVLHVESPGGSAFASDLIWRAVKRLAEDKPVVASFGDVAASGGYYVSAAAREIVARSVTLTGSIGVVGGKLVAAGAMRKLGVVSQTFAADLASLWLSPSRRFSAEERVRVKASFQRVYNGFVERVAEGRGTTPEEVEPYCRGRVWTGKDARERGLVDREGTTFDAVERVAELASLPKGVWRREDRSPANPKAWAAFVRGQLMRRMPLGAFAPSLEALGMLLQATPGQALALLPWRIDLR
jgi:protease-4